MLRPLSLALPREGQVPNRGPAPAGPATDMWHTDMSPPLTRFRLGKCPNPGGRGDALTTRIRVGCLFMACVLFVVVSHWSNVLLIIMRNMRE